MIKSIFYPVSIAAYLLLNFFIVPWLSGKILGDVNVSGSPIEWGLTLLFVGMVVCAVAFITGFFISRCLFYTYWPALISLGAGLLLTFLISLLL